MAEYAVVCIPVDQKNLEPFQFFLTSLRLLYRSVEQMGFELGLAVQMGVGGVDHRGVVLGQNGNLGACNVLGFLGYIFGHFILLLQVEELLHEVCHLYRFFFGIQQLELILAMQLFL